MEQNPLPFALLHGIMRAQDEFETAIMGTDGTLKDFNSPEYALERGVIGEAKEALEALQAGQWDHAKEEAIDTLIFLATLFNHLEMTPEEVEELALKKMESNWQKYDPEKFKGKTIKEGIIYCRENWKTNGTVTV